MIMIWTRFQRWFGANSTQLYQPKMFMYAWGPFHMAKDEEDHPQLVVNANEVDGYVPASISPVLTKILTGNSHPGNYNSEQYHLHCPQATLPSANIQGTVIQAGGGLNSNGLATLLNYDLQTTVFDNAAKAQTSFTFWVYLKLVISGPSSHQ